MSEQYPISREEFRRFVSHDPDGECSGLCDELQDQFNAYEQTDDPEEKARILRIIRAIKSRMVRLHCPPCLVE